jgi:hypothetical protein
MLDPPNVQCVGIQHCCIYLILSFHMCQQDPAGDPATGHMAGEQPLSGLTMTGCALVAQLVMIE